MSRVFFISDLHLGDTPMMYLNNNFRMKLLGLEVKDIYKYDLSIIENINLRVRKGDILFILGDLGTENFELIEYIQCQKKIILGNHDTHPMRRYSGLHNTEVISSISYKGYWLTHIPIHPDEMRNRKGNIHGHTHTHCIKDERYINVCLEPAGGLPVLFQDIVEGKYTTHNWESPYTI